MTGTTIQTVKGDVSVNSLGMWLPHEHLFTDLRGPMVPGYAEGDPLDVEYTVRPHLEAAAAAGARVGNAAARASTGCWRTTSVFPARPSWRSATASPMPRCYAGRGSG